MGALFEHVAVNVAHKRFGFLIASALSLPLLFYAVFFDDVGLHPVVLIRA